MLRGDGKVRVTLHPTAGDEPTTWHAYQRYYLRGLNQLDAVDFRYEQRIDSMLGRVRELGVPGSHWGWSKVVSRTRARRYPQATHVGRYTFEFPGSTRPLRVAIDSHDGRRIRDPEALEWAQLYFKVSYWPTLDYGPKVRPLICGNGALDAARIARLKGLRNPSKRDLDLTFVAKLWPSNPDDATYWNPVEHLVRVFEQLGRLPIRTHLRAIIPWLAPGTTFPQHYLDRLHQAGVPVTREDISVDELWDVTSRAELAFLRPGKHLCVSWRMIDHLALGACTLCDNAAYPEWPVPLQQGREFQDCECGIGPDESLPDMAQYQRIGDQVMSLLADRERMAESRRAAAAYFDAHVAPAQLATHILEVARKEARYSRDQVPLLPPPRCAEPEVAPVAHAPLATDVDVVDTGVHPAHTSLLEFTNDAVIIWEMNGRGILYWNRAAEQLYGFTSEESRSNTTHALLRTELSGGVPALESTLARYGIWVGELRHTHKSGATVYVEARLALLSQTSGGWLVLEVNRDISDRKLADAERHSMQTQLEQLRSWPRAAQSG
jgi:PAS domain S-box-containing protein